ncbi:hypothetical protein [Burkholderia territorii]|uniref:hypothetical protein n=1 Tax=Burkholderia territorii TaxID=1503055 RepID=UPI0012D86739|nr:hypothetical protein [Burkholderia territorii]
MNVLHLEQVRPVTDKRISGIAPDGKTAGRSTTVLDKFWCDENQYADVYVIFPSDKSGFARCF